MFTLYLHLSLGICSWQRPRTEYSDSLGKVNLWVCVQQMQGQTQKGVGPKVVPWKGPSQVPGHMLSKRTAQSLTLKKVIYRRAPWRNSACCWFIACSTLGCEGRQVLPHNAGQTSCTYATGTEQETRHGRWYMRGD